MRLFLGVPLPESTKNLLVSLYSLFHNISSSLKFVDFNNLHVTLLFIGEVSDSKAIIDSLSDIDFHSFNASLENFSVFPNLKLIRVIHSPVVHGANNFVSLHDEIANALGFKPDDSFTPHATIARLKDKINSIDLLSVIQNITFNESFTVDSFTLYESTLTPKGPVYKVVREFILKPQHLK